jgi:putative membrane protein
MAYERRQRTRNSERSSGTIFGAAASNGGWTLLAKGASMIRTLAAVTALLFFTGSAWAADQKPTDPQIAHIAYTAGQIDIAAGKQASSKATNPEVKAFAGEMVRDHQSVNDQALALLKKLNVTPQDNPTSQSLSKAADAKHAELNKLSGAAYDRAYIENEIAFHKTVNSALKDTLIPDAQNAELKSLLETGLKLFESHQAHAEQIAAKLGK